MFDFPEVPTNERYDGVTITLGEWFEMGFYQPFTDESWRFDFYSESQYERFCHKFIDRFYDREVSIPTASIWKRAYLRKLNEIMPKYKILYERIEEGVNPFQDGREHSKSRDIFSDFPETMLSGNSDYASTGNDREADMVREGSAADKAAQFAQSWKDVDAMILDELERTLFTSFIATTVPLW